MLAVAYDHPLATHDSVSCEVVADYAVADVEGLSKGMRDAVSPSTTPSGRPIRRALTFRRVPEVLAAVARGDIVHPASANDDTAASRGRRRPANRRLGWGGRGDRRAGVRACAAV